MDPSSMVVAVVVAALIFDFTNGWNDSANSIATAVSTRVLRPGTAIAFAAVLNFAGAFASTAIAKMIGTGLIRPEAFGSPLLGFILSYALLVVVFWLARDVSYRSGQRIFGGLQILSSAFMSFQHGQNDAQKVMGVIAMSLFAGGMLHDDAGRVITDAANLHIPLWVILACGSVIALGTAVGGWRVIRTLGTKLADLTPVEGFAAETVAGLVLQLAASAGVPVSTTHTITGSILGVGSVHSIRRVRWMLGAKIVYAWVLTLPCTFVLAWMTSAIIHGGR